ncbi:hypothetical protein JHK82_045123 [Glycine max]|uniref:Uncharacterized protein n=2 Tax=Glycine subgen. Soja TaxID=1462606 RepID=I1MNQ7_SOYBN|nr:uncharacterized protein LOC100783425 [Glycine max]XP_028206288.1 uncharacterized protein LOC114389738 [Glycine soja]KAG4939399.1 hypothetical protein JHK86_045540 [Glycine max]KAG5100071.1 hypothetical protein JHK82_045123 [Glycine max]KAH1206615.1 hypothetical protein GmHk_16G047012 [Glycine max]KHN13405.1 hypothetical protein glysoja_026835 [Glycine soja]KRH08436.1 hypothetical protein GLYMA_16G149600v4 [Glycine max]|eukprot:XP_003548925.1 uncharacterized protein LOC100783425 [Glycine max]
MEAHSPVIAKKLWNVLRITFFMIRKGLVSKRKLIMDMNLMMKKGKLLRKSMSNFMSSHHHHHHHHSKSLARGYGMQEYEFSCSNSPSPVFFHVPKKKHHFNFPCMNTTEVVEEPRPVVLVPNMTPEYTFNHRFDNASDFAPGERISPFTVRISNYSSEDEENEQEGGNGNAQVDDQAEAFIRRFYEQLRMQSRMQLLEYQEM